MSIKKIQKAADYLRSAGVNAPKIGVILGSGLGGFARNMSGATVHVYKDIPGFSVSTVPGHAGELCGGSISGKRALLMNGRFHYYEGNAPTDIAFPIRVMYELGVETLIVTNATGAVNTSFRPGELALITDHINMSGVQPLIGKNYDELGPRFPDMSAAYDKELRAIALNVAAQLGQTLREGVYAMMPGPSFETPAEIRMLRTLGADLVGMSTVPEVIVARHCGLRVLGISCVTNMAAGILDVPLSHQEVIETGAQATGRFEALLKGIFAEL